MLHHGIVSAEREMLVCVHTIAIYSPYFLYFIKCVYIYICIIKGQLMLVFSLLY